MGRELLAKYLEDNNKETQTAFADRAGVSAQAVSGWLSGERWPDVTSAVAIARATDGAVPVESWVRQNDGRRHESDKATTKTA